MHKAWLVISLYVSSLSRSEGHAPSADGAVPLPAKSTLFTWEEHADNDEHIQGAEARGRGLASLFKWLRPETSSNDQALEWEASGTRYRSSSSSSSSQPPLVPHPLRTNLWEVTCRWRGRTYAQVELLQRQQQQQQEQQPQQHAGSHRSKYRYSTLLFNFDPSGYVLVKAKSNHRSDEEIDGDWRTMGTWSMEPAGVKCSIPISPHLKHLIHPDACSESLDGKHSDDKVSEPSFGCNDGSNELTMDFHVNPFGSQPKFTRGIIFGARDTGRRQSRWQWLPLFSPVIATFTGRGVGVDTADLSYRKRQMPLAGS